MARTTHPDLTPPAPGDLEIVRGFLSLHEHDDDPDVSYPPSGQTLRAFLVEHGLLGPNERATEAQLEGVRRVHAALHRIVEAGRDHPAADEDLREVERAARDAELRPRFGADPPRLEPGRGGLPGAIGRILAVAFLARIDGTWDDLKVCASETCTAVFFDRSKNHSGRWCSMQVCGNRTKVRAWRERHRTGHGANA